MATKKRKPGQAITKKAEPPKKDYTWLWSIGIVAGVIAAIILIVVAVNLITNAVNRVGKYTAEIVVKDYGTITVELDGDTAPITVKNFVGLAQSGFYDGLTFHRIMEGFMIQGGDPEHNGYGGSENTITGEFSANGIKNDISHERGVISMARGSNSFDSASSQFFIVHQDYPSLDGYYAAFGHVTSGMEVVDRIVADADPTDDNGTIPFEEQPVIERITVRKK